MDGTEGKGLSEKFYAEKLKRAVHLLFFKRGRTPGVKSWELKTSLGKDYEEVLKQLNQLLGDIDLEVKEVEEETPSSTRFQTATGEAESRFLVTLKGGLTLREARMCGWRIDNLAGLTMAIAYAVSKQGKAPRKEVEETLARKFGRWRSMVMMDIFIRSRYLEEDETGLIGLGWRTKAEVDLRSIMTLLLESAPSEDLPETSSDAPSIEQDPDTFSP